MGSRRYAGSDGVGAVFGVANETGRLADNSRYTITSSRSLDFVVVTRAVTAAAE